ncbi:bifunctional DNA primase/helicase [Streptomyces scabiei]|uniref:bifunctional DNA primase/helicase n=1 Tax=Streptomyces scabiei TaxID=1930 RepID=UPI0029BC3488|nr:bifunctional DNA primase/helicase [Streptomyces scabiei]MDX2833490.1 bifunctional DNA primase/helicase [Streptomyces scabiei]
MKATPGPDRSKYGDIPAKVRVITRGPWERETVVKLPSGFKAQRAYIYRNADGSIAFIKFRGTRIERSEVDGFELEQKLKGWKESALHPYDKEKHSGLLYGADVLAAMVETSDTDTVLYLVGGEKDAETAWDLGQFATTPPNGEGSLSAEQLEILREFKGLVVVVRDKDDPGTKFAANAVAFLGAMGVRWEIKEAKSDTEGADLTDHITELGWELEDLVDVDLISLKLSKERNVDDLELSPFLAKLDVAFRVGEGWMVHCPGPMHKNGDKNPSLSVNHVDGKWLLFCHGGCDTKDVLAAVDMDWTDLFESEISEEAQREKDIQRAAYKHEIGILGKKLGEERLREAAGLNFEDPNNRMWSPGDIATAQRKRIDWLVKGFWSDCSHGVIGGREKSLKSYWLDLMVLAVALGVKFLGQYEVKHSTVYMLIGEGDPSDRFERLRRMAKDVYDKDIAEAKLYIRTRACSWDSDEFAGFMKESRDAGAQVVALDSVYNYQPPGIDVQNMYERGFALGSLSQAVGTDRTLILVDHFRKNGSADLDLASLAQAAMGPWADTWVLMKHRAPAAPSIGQFEIELSAGSRRGYGKHLDITWYLGPFDDDEGCHTGEIAVTALSHDPATASSGKAGEVSASGIQAFILKYFEENGQVVKTQCREVAKDQLDIGQRKFDDAWKRLESEGRLKQIEPGKPRSMWVLLTQSKNKISNFGGK